MNFRVELFYFKDKKAELILVKYTKRYQGSNDQKRKWELFQNKKFSLKYR